MDKPSFRLPGENLRELERVVTAYFNRDKELSTRELAERTLVVQGEISRNVGFLIDFGILEEGGKYKYKLTSPGQRLAQALDREHPDHTAWCEILAHSSHLESILHPLKVTPEGRTEKQLVQYLFRVAKHNPHAKDLTKHYRLGATTLIDALKEAGIIREQNKKLVLIPENEWGSSNGSAPPAIPIIDWSCVGDDLKALLERDYQELRKLREGGKDFALKSKLVLCGSILEAVLVSILSKNKQSAQNQYGTTYREQKSPDGKALVQNESKLHSLIGVVQDSGISDAQLITDILKDYWKLVQEKHQDPKVPQLDEWKFYQLIEVSHKLHLLNKQQKHIADYLRDNRNFVHLIAEIRSDESTLEPGTVEAILALFDGILKHLSKLETSQRLVGQNAVADHD